MTFRKTAAAAVLAGAFAFAAGGASAATFDFIGYAAGNEQGVADGTTIDFDGVGITFTAGPGGSDKDFAYFDDLSGGKPAGLGVCTVISGSKQCMPSSDDNVSADGADGSPEYVTLAFDTILTSFQVTSFYDANHNSLATSMSTLLINGSQYSFKDALATIFTDVSSITFKYGGEKAAQFYIGGAVASTVPLPASALLLLGGLGGLGLMRARRKA